MLRIDFKRIWGEDHFNARVHTARVEGFDDLSSYWIYCRNFEKQGSDNAVWQRNFNEGEGAGSYLTEVCRLRWSEQQMFRNGWNGATKRNSIFTPLVLGKFSWDSVRSCEHFTGFSFFFPNDIQGPFTILFSNSLIILGPSLLWNL